MIRPRASSILRGCLAGLVLLAGCSPDRSAGGGGFEGETVALSGVVQHRGHMLANASVAFVAIGSNDVVGSTRTDSLGEFTLHLPATTTRGFVEARSGDTALVRQLVDAIPDAPLYLATVPAISWSARATLDGLPAAGASLRIVGSTANATCDSLGRFTMVRMTTGVEWGTVKLRDGTTRDVEFPPVSDSVLPLPSRPAIPYDDFDDGDARTTLGTLIGSGWWFAITDRDLGGRSESDPPSALSDIRTAIGPDDAWKGNSLSIRFLVDRTRPVYYAIVGTVIANDNEWLDLSTLDSISFMAKGSGTMRVDFVTRANIEPTPDSLGYFGSDVALPESWTRVVVRRRDIAALPGSRPVLQGISWAEASHQTRNISFSVKDTATIKIDDIVLHGPTLSELSTGH